MRICTSLRLVVPVLLVFAAAGPAAAQAADDAAGKLFDRLWARMDKDGDGALSAAEGEALAERMFERRDANSDAALTRDEFMATKGAGRLSADQQAKLEAFRAQRFAETDKNGDGRVSAEEYFAAAQGRFEAADANHDGRVTKEEISALRGAL
jgi:Ca2+-binding EF-hand superfamily protein